MLLMGFALYVFIDENMLSKVSPDVPGYDHVLYFIMIIAGEHKFSQKKICPPFQHLLSERLTSLGIMGAPRVPP